MKDEQIKQNAKLIYGQASNSEDKINAYIAGAHSRDEEINQLRIALSSAQTAMAELAQMARNPWISVKDRMPDREEPLTRFSEDVLCALDNGEFYVTDYFDYERNRWNSFPDGITHWMPIPKLERTNY